MKKKHDRALVIGNGPSLRKDISSILKYKNLSDIYCVNYFAYDDLFFNLKPSFYLLADPIFWRNDINQLMASDRELLIQKLLLVDWDINIICPKIGAKVLSNYLSANKNIKIVGIPNNACYFNSEKISIFALKYKITTPVFGNVLIFALWQSIINGHKKIDIYGADFSMFKELYVDQETNELLSSAPHFYKNTQAQADSGDKYQDKPKKKIHTRLLQAYKGFRQMYLISIYANLSGISIINKSSSSYLDCFSRKRQ